MTLSDRTKTRLGRRAVLGLTIAAVGLAVAVGVRANPDPVDLKVVDRETAGSCGRGAITGVCSWPASRARAIACA